MYWVLAGILSLVVVVDADRIQEVTVEISGIAATVLGFGDIKVETAGHGTLLLRSTAP